MAVQKLRSSLALPCLALALLVGAPPILHSQDGPAGAISEETAAGAPSSDDTGDLNPKQQALLRLGSADRSFAKAQKLDQKAAAATDPKKQADLRAKAKAAYESAIGDYQAALKLDPKLIEAYVGLGELMVRAGRFDQAIQIVEQALALEPGSVKALTAKGHAQLASFKVSDAKATYDRLVAESAKAGRAFLAEMRAWLEVQRAKLGPEMAEAVAELDAWIKEREAS